MQNYPPQPRLTLTIGVIGHRPNRLAAADEEQIKSEVERVIDQITHEVGVVHKRYKGFFSATAPQLCLVSALAEGADQLVARAAHAKGFVLDAPIPFLKDEYSRDFVGGAVNGTEDRTPGLVQSDALVEFESLAAEGVMRSLLELPGKRSDSLDAWQTDKAYEMAGLTVISQADILLTVWDQGPSGGRGGTADMLHKAARRGVPIIDINTGTPSDTRIRWSRLQESPIAAEQITDLPDERFDQVLPRLIEETLRPPSSPTERDALHTFLGVTGKGWRGAVRGFYRTWLDGGPRLAARAANHARDYQRLMISALGENASSSATSLTHLALVFGWADVTAIRFAGAFRRAYWLNFMMSAAAVVAALCLLLTEGHWPLAAELVLIFLVVVNTSVGRRLQWHRRWMEAREISERVRVAILFWILGTQPPAFYGEEPAWTGWYARAVIREQGMRGGRLDRNGMTEARTAMLGVLKDQHQYHHKNARKMKWREDGLEWIGFILFSATFVIAIVHLRAEAFLDCLFHNYPGHELVLVMLSAILPTLATASYGIRLIGDFEGIAKRSERAAQAQSHVIEALLRDPSDLTLFRARAQNIADAMLGDVASWRLSAESRGLAIPG